MVELILEEALPDSVESVDGQPATLHPPAGTHAFTPLFVLILQPWLDELLLALKCIITNAWEGKWAGPAVQQNGGAAARIKNHQGARRRPNRAHRELGILERLGGAVTSAATAHLLGDALAALVTGVVTGPVQRRGARARLDEVRH